MKILALGAHPDDIEIFMYGLVSIFKKEGNQVFTMIATDGAKGGSQNDETLKKIRAEETTAGLKNLCLPIFLNIPDSELGQNPIHQKIIKEFDSPIKSSSHLRILYGNLASEGAVAKITGKEGTSFEGRARVFNSEEEGVEAILSKSIQPGDVVVIRYEGPKGGPGMREMLKPTSAIMGQGLGDKVGFITDGRFSGGTHGFVVGHITPEAADGGVIAIIEDDDVILIDANKDELTLKVPEEEIQDRFSKWSNPKTPPKKGVLSKFAKSVKSASLGAVTD